MRCLMAFAVLLVLTACGGADDPAMAKLEPAEETLEQVMDKHLEARGGRERLAALQGIKKIGLFTNKGGRVESENVPTSLVVERPGLYVRQMEFEPGQMSIQVVGDDLAWHIFHPTGITEPTEMTELQERVFRRRADLDGSLVDWQEKGHQVQLLGKGEIDGRPIYALQMDFADGESATVYLDAETHLVFRVYERQEASRGWVELEHTFEDYQDVEGVMWASTEVIKLAFAKSVQTFKWTGFEANPEVSEDLYKMPGA